MRRKGLIPAIGYISGVLIISYIICYHLITHDDKEINSTQQIAQSRKTKREEPPSALDILFDRSMKWAEQTRLEKLSTLLQNPIYEQFNIKERRKRKNGRIVKIAKRKVDILIIVSSGPRRSDRRQGIRETWWKHCIPTSGVIPKCWFFTDQLGRGDKLYRNLTREQKKYRDILFQPLRGGIEFGIRFIYHLVWAMARYDFNYFVRVDDDYFLCLQRLLKELPIGPALTNFHWGWTHCIHEMIRPEESLILLSRDLVETFLLQNPHEIRCHPWADQMMGVWVTDLNILTLFRHDDRVHHAPIVDKAPHLRYNRKICNSFIGIHGTYPNDMKLFWNQRGGEIRNFTSVEERDKTIGNLLTNSAECEKPHNFNYLLFEPEWQYEPKRCIYNPKWNTGKQNTIDGVYDGRQDNKRLAAEVVSRE